MQQKEIVSCKIAAALISKSLEVKLTLKETIMMKGHLAICRTCNYYAKQIKALKLLFNKYSSAITQLSTKAKQTLSPQAKQRIKSAIQQNI